MAFTVIYDANVLYPSQLRDLLIRIAMTGVVRGRWTDEILDEVFRAVLRERPGLDPEKLQRTRRLMNRAIRDVLVTGYEDLVESLEMPDADDRHVLAAAIRAGAQVIVTFNLKDFPADALRQYGIEAMHPDDFVLDVIGLAPAEVVAVVTEQASALKNPPQTRDDVLDALAARGLAQSVARLRGLFGQKFT